jgi:hypothetical protein
MILPSRVVLHQDTHLENFSPTSSNADPNNMRFFAQTELRHKHCSDTIPSSHSELKAEGSHSGLKMLAAFSTG